MKSALYYFLSTLAQSFAALTAFVFMAAQNRVAWLDGRITAVKMALLYRLHGGTLQIDYYMNTVAASEAVLQGEKKSDPTTQRLSSDLKDLLEQIQTLRAQMKTQTVLGISITLASMILIATVPLIESEHTIDHKVAWTIIGIGAAAGLLGGGSIGWFIFDSISVSLKKALK